MAPSFDQLPQDGYDDEIDISEVTFDDLEAQYEVKLEEGLDTFVVLDGIPRIAEDAKPKLIKYLLRKLNSVGKTSEDAIFMPMTSEGISEGYAFVEYQTTQQAAAAVKSLHGTALDKKHTMSVNKLTDIERYGREGRVNDTYTAPEIEPFKEKEHLRSWLGDEECRDQFVMYRGDNVGVYWNEKEDAPKNEVDRQHWTERFVLWSPKGTYLTSMHVKGVLLWGGPSWSRLKRFPHPGVDLVDFSPNENYITTWSHRPIELEENDPNLTADEDGKSYIIWDVATGKPLRSFNNIEPIGPATDPDGNPIKKKLIWPAFKWSSDDAYVARMTQGKSVSVYDLPSMALMDKKVIPIEGVVDFEWSPSLPQRDGIRTYEQIFCYWTPELGSVPAKVGLMSIPSREIVRTRNLFNVSDAKLHWQSKSKFVCVKVDRQKSKKSFTTNLEIFRLQEKGVPVEVVDALKDRVINFQWEPAGDRFVLITAGDEMIGASAVPPKTGVSFFCPEKAKGPGTGNFKLIRTLEKRNSNAIYWSPRGRFVVVATVGSNQSYEMDFWDVDYEGEKEEKDKDLQANLQQMGTADHYSVTEVEWDPTGRYVTSSSSIWRNAVSPLPHFNQPITKYHKS